MLAETNIFNPEAYLQESSFNDYKFKLKEEKKLSKIKKIKKVKIIEPDFTNLVYVIKCNNSYKIGQTISLKKRMQSLKAIIPEQLELVIKIEGVDHRAFERFLHLKFKAQRLRGEWFNLSEEHLDYIKSEQCLNDFKSL